MRNIMCYIFLARFYGTVSQTISVGGDDAVCNRGANKWDVDRGVCQGQETTNRPLVRIEPNKVGEVVEITIGNRKLNRVTRAIQPPVFEIPDFLTKEECDTIIYSAKQQGLEQSSLFDISVNVTEDIQKRNLKDVWRVSNQTFLKYHGEVLVSIREKVVQLTGLPKQIIFGSELLQVLRYGPGGHYHAHWDSENTKLEPGFTIATKDTPCCHQTKACKSIVTMSTCCRLCRLATVLFYLNDVEEGGETAFPFARLKKDDKLPLMENRTEGNLSYNCHTAKLVVKPRRGTAILWYSHFLDKEGWMGRVDPASYHGGCEIIKGVKWIANTWINAGEYNERNVPSIWTGI